MRILRSSMRATRVAPAASRSRAIGMVAIQQRRAGAVTGLQHAGAGVADVLDFPDRHQRGFTARANLDN
jgi:hypothetical protein